MNSDFAPKAFLSTLEDRQKESRLYVDTIADLLEGHAPNFEIYAVRGLLVWFPIVANDSRRIIV